MPRFDTRNCGLAIAVAPNAKIHDIGPTIESLDTYAGLTITISA